MIFKAAVYVDVEVEFFMQLPVSKTKWLLVLGMFMALVEGRAYGQTGQSHEYIMMMRSSVQHHVFVSQSVEGEYGTFRTSGESAAAS